RSQGQSSASDDFMGVLRIQAHQGVFRFGLSSVFGNTAQRSSAIRTGSFQLGETHAQIILPRAQILGMYALAEVQDADAISIMNSTVMAQQAKGFSVQGAFDIIGGQQKLWLFTRYSHYNLHDRVPETLIADPALKKSATTLGVSYFPLAALVIKADYQW